MNATLKKPLTTCQEQRRAYFKRRRESTPQAWCLELARSRFKGCNCYLVRLPRKAGVGYGFELQLALRADDLASAEDLALDKMAGLSQPDSKPDGGLHHYIVADRAKDGDQNSWRYYLKGLVQALWEFGMSESAQIFHADPEAGVLRRVVAVQPEGGAA